MQSKRPTLGAVAVALAGAILIAACGAGGGKTVAFGEIVDFTGPSSATAPYANSGVLSAEYEINASGGILGKKVVNVPVDTKSDPADGLVALKQALATNTITAEFGPGTDVAAALVPILQNAHVMTDCPCGANPQYDHSTDPYFWRLAPPDPVGGETLSLYAKERGYSRVATVFGTDTGSQGDLPGVVTGLKAAGLSLVANIGLTPDQTSYRTQVEQLIASKPQVIFTESDGQTAAAFFGELKQLGTVVPIFGTTATAASTFLKPLASAIGVADFSKDFVAETGAPSVPSPGATEAANAFNNGVRHVASKLPAPSSQWLNNTFSESNYDGLVMFALAMMASHSTDATVANRWIPKVTEAAPGKIKVYTYAQGVAALKAGKAIQYIGASGPIRFDRWHSSFGDQAIEKLSPAGTVLSVKIIPASQIQAVG